MSASVLAWVVSSLTEEQQGAGRDWEELGGTGRGGLAVCDAVSSGPPPHSGVGLGWWASVL